MTLAARGPIPSHHARAQSLKTVAIGLALWGPSALAARPPGEGRMRAYRTRALGGVALMGYVPPDSISIHPELNVF